MVPYHSASEGACGAEGALAPKSSLGAMAPNLCGLVLELAQLLADVDETSSQRIVASFHLDHMAAEAAGRMGLAACGMPSEEVVHPSAGNHHCQ